MVMQCCITNELYDLMEDYCWVLVETGNEGDG